MKEIEEEVKERLKDVHVTTRELVITRRLDKEIEERVNLLDAFLVKRQDVQAQLNKINRPDVEERFNANGEKAVEASYSKGRLDEIRKAQETLKKYDDALAKAMVPDGKWDAMKAIVK